MNENIQNIQIPLKFINRRSKTIHSDGELDNFIKSTILEWSEKDFTCPNAIQTYIYKTIEPHSMKLYFSQCYHNIHSMKTHIDLVQTINSHIWALFITRPAVTFLDIYKMIEAICTNGQIRVLGPLTKIPIVKSYIFGNKDVNYPTPDIRLSDLILDCAKFLTEKLVNSKTTKELEIVTAQSEKQFLHFLMNKYHVNNFNLLGIKIVNFPALRNAAYAAKCESFHKLISNEKLTKLLRADVKKAIKNVRSKLSTNNIFIIDDKPIKNILDFASLPFSEAIKRFFQPFLDEEEKIFGNDINLTNENTNIIENVKNIITFLIKEKTYGRLFQLAAIAGSMHQCKGLSAVNIKMNVSEEPIEISSKLSIEDWRSKMFCPLLMEINSFTYLYFLNSDNIDNCMSKLESLKQRIIERCKQICQLFPEELQENSKISYPEISKYKFLLLNSLSSCCRAIIEHCSEFNSVKDTKNCSKLYADFLPQAHNLLVAILSKCKIGTFQLERQNTIEINADLIDCILKSKLLKYTKENLINKNNISLDLIRSLEGDILNILNINSWPLDGSFIEFILKRRDLIYQIIEENKNPILDVIQETEDQSQNEKLNCQCIGLREEFINEIMKRMPNSITLDSFMNQILPTMNGVIMNNASLQSISGIWENHLHQQHFHEDGLPGAIDLRMKTIAKNKTGSLNDILITNPDHVMCNISQVSLLDNVTSVMKWNAIYRYYWGDICKFVNDHSLLAEDYNIRLIKSEMGVLRVHSRVNINELNFNIKSMMTGDDETFLLNAKHIIVECISVLIKTSTISSLELCQIIDLLSTNFLENSQKNIIFQKFCISAITMTPPELITDISCNLIYPLARRVLLDIEIDNILSSVLSSIDSTLLMVMKIDLISDHPLAVIVKQIDRRNLLPRTKISKKVEQPILNENLNDFLKKYDNFQSTEIENVEITSSTSEVNTLEREKYDIVEDIRFTEFGVGLSLSDNTSKKVVDNFNKKMARLVDHLSNDLYANESHFILELIQNADDNKYSTHIRPQLDLSWRNTNNGLILEVINNELGFTESDLRSLCDIGASTKSELRTNKIGRKGIGFKSVFLVSNSPEIHSNGFHIKFERYCLDENNRKVSNNGMIPMWCEKPDFIKNDQHTTILLPIIPSLENDIRLSVDVQIKPHLLLFLRNINKISVTSNTENNETCERSIELVKEECTHNRRVVLSHTGEKFSWFIRTEQMPIIDLHLQKISPRGLSYTELSVAIPLIEQESHDLPAFAFLPIRSYGLRFIINADFAIPASREDIVNESAWNKWLIDQVAQVFTRHLLDYLTNSKPISHEYLIRLIECVPLPGEIPCDSSFHALIPKLRSNLTNLPWLPDRYDNMHAPSKLIIETVDDSQLTEVLCNRLQLNLLHPIIACCTDERVIRVLSWLGCQSLSLLHLSKLLTVLEPEDFTDKSLMKSIIIAIHTALGQDSSIVTINRVVTQLCSLPIWPVITEFGEQYVRIDQSTTPIFLPPSHWISTSVKSDSYFLLRRVISPQFILSYQKTSNKHVNVATSILQRLGVIELSSNSMINIAIVPFLSQSNISREWFVSVAQFLLDKCHPSQYIDSVIPKLNFATISYNSDGKSSETISNYTDLSKVHLSTTMQSNGNVIHLFRNNIDFIVLDDVYLETSTIKSSQWQEFFISVGVAETFYTVPKDKNEITFPEIEFLLNLNNKRISIDLLRYIDMNWSQNSKLRSPFFLKNLQSQCCIPVCNELKDLNEPDQLLNISLPMKRPQDTLYLTSSNPNKILMPDSLLRHFPVCPVIFSSNLPQNLGMINNIGVEHVMKLLFKVFVEKSVYLTGRQSYDLYSWMKHNLSQVSLKNIFSHLKLSLNGAMLIAVPSDKDDEQCELLLDEFCYWTLPIVDASTKHVFLQDQQVYEDLKVLIKKETSCDSNRIRSLINLFPDLKELFVDVLEVREFPRVRDMWSTFENLLNLLNSDRLKDLNFVEIELITDVYNVIQFLDSVENGQHRSDLLKMRLIPCLSGNYRSFHDNTADFAIYSWRSFHTVHAFQQNLIMENAPIDYIAINCFSKQKKRSYDYFHNPNRLHRWSASEFLMHYFNLPVLEDEMCYRVINHQSFQPCKEVQSILHHLEVIVTQWFQRNVQKDGVSHCINLLSSITKCCSSEEDVSISVFLRNREKIGYQYSENVYIGNIDQTDTFELLLGGIDLKLDGMQALDIVMNALIHWILKGDQFNHLIERFKKFYKSLFDLIESSDRNQVTIFIRSHNLRINPFSIDYIYEKFASDLKEIEFDSTQYFDNNPSESSSPSVHEMSLEGGNVEEVTSVMCKTDKSERKLKRRVCVSIENIVPQKQIRLEIESHSSENKIQKQLQICANTTTEDEITVELKNRNEKRLESLSVKVDQNMNNKNVESIKSEPGSGRSSPLSNRIKEQFTSQKHLRLSVLECSPENLFQISGRIGEQLAFQKLTITQRLGEWEILKVDWINQYKESRLPYDFKLSARRPDSGRIEVIYLEVKATTQPNKTQFDLSPQEVTAAWSFKEHYHLLLIFHSGNYPDENTKFVHIPDTLGQLKDNQCKLLFDVRSILEQSVD